MLDSSHRVSSLDTLGRDFGTCQTPAFSGRYRTVACNGRLSKRSIDHQSSNPTLEDAFRPVRYNSAPVQFGDELSSKVITFCRSQEPNTHVHHLSTRFSLVHTVPSHFLPTRFGSRVVYEYQPRYNGPAHWYNRYRHQGDMRLQSRETGFVLSDHEIWATSLYTQHHFGSGTPIYF